MNLKNLKPFKADGECLLSSNDVWTEAIIHKLYENGCTWTMEQWNGIEVIVRPGKTAINGTPSKDFCSNSKSFIRLLRRVDYSEYVSLLWNNLRADFNGEKPRFEIVEPILLEHGWKKSRRICDESSDWQGMSDDIYLRKDQDPFPDPDREYLTRDEVLSWVKINDGYLYRKILGRLGICCTGVDSKKVPSCSTTRDINKSECYNGTENSKTVLLEREYDMKEDVSEVSTRTAARERNEQLDSDRKCENDTNKLKVDFLENKYDAEEVESGGPNCTSTKEINGPLDIELECDNDTQKSKVNFLGSEYDIAKEKNQCRYVDETFVSSANLTYFGFDKNLWPVLNSLGWRNENGLIITPNQKKVVGKCGEDVIAFLEKNGRGKEDKERKRLRRELLVEIEGRDRKRRHIFGGRRIEDVHFTTVWRSLNNKHGWTYTTDGKYYPPNSISLNDESGKELRSFTSLGLYKFLGCTGDALNQKTYDYSQHLKASILKDDFEESFVDAPVFTYEDDLRSKSQRVNLGGQKILNRSRKRSLRSDTYFTNSISGNRKSSNFSIPSPKECATSISTDGASFQSCLHSFEEDFEQWSFLLRSGHSVLLYGLGSKKILMDRFADKTLRHDGSFIKVDGYDEKFDVSEFLDWISTTFFDKDNKISDTVQESHVGHFNENNKFRASAVGLGPLPSRAANLARFAASQFENPLFILVYNIEGSGVANKVTQSTFASLAAFSDSKIRLICSCDNVDVFSLWDVSMLSRYRWIYIKASTHERYINEVSNMESEKKSRTTGNSNEKTVKGIVNVLESLAKKHDDVMKTLAMIISEKSYNYTDIGVPYKTFFDACIEQMLIKSDSELRDVLGELVDHKIVELRRDDAGTEYVGIPFSHENIEEILSLRRKK